MLKHLLLFVVLGSAVRAQPEKIGLGSGWLRTHRSVSRTALSQTIGFETLPLQLRLEGPDVII
jgi:hypothetical protein